MQSSVHDKFISGLVNVQVVGRYKIIRKLGEGGAGVVYLARDSYINRYVAIKISQPMSKKNRKKLFLEARSAGRLNHPNIVSVYDTGVYKDFCYTIMEFIEGGTLKDYCSKETRLPLNRAIEIVFKVCNALGYAHQQGVIHRDIKPSNILLDKDQVPRIVDFGIARMTEQTSEKGFFGTPSYMAPEQIKEEITGQSSDIFSLGCVLYELVSGKIAFPGENEYAILYKIAHDDPAPLVDDRQDLPDILVNIIDKAMAKEVDERYASCMDLAFDLRVALRGLQEFHSDDKKIEDVIDLIRHVPFFQSFSREQLHALGLVSHILKVGKGKVIMSQGEIDDTFYVILNGRAMIRKNDQVIAVIKAGECFGEMAYIAGQARIASVVADTDCVLMKISATLLDKAPESIQLLFFRNFARTLAFRLSKGSDRKSQQ